MVSREAGDFAYSVGDYVAAHQHWSTAITTDPYDARALSSRSMVRLAHYNDIAGALEDAEAAVAAERSYALSFVRLEAALRCSEGDGQFSKVIEIFHERDTHGSPIRPSFRSSGKYLDLTSAHGGEDFSNLNTSVQAIIAAGDRDKASEAAIAGAKVLRNLRSQVYIRTNLLIHDKLPKVENWVERIQRRVEIKLTKENKQAPDSIVAEPSATSADLTSGLMSLPTALIRLVLSFWDFEQQRTRRMDHLNPCDYVNKLPLSGICSLRGASRLGFHIVTRRMLAPLVSSRTFTWEHLARIPADVLGGLENLNVALASDRSFRDDDDDYMPSYGFGGGEDGDDEDGYRQSDNALLVGCLLKACRGNNKNVSAVRVLSFHGALHAKTACAIGAFCPRLQCLNFDNVTVRSDLFEELVCCCPLLKTLKVGQYGADDEMLGSLSRVCPLLRHFSCESCRRVSDAGLLELSAGCVNLTYVDVTRSSVSDVGVASLIYCCRGLQTLHLKGCTNVSIAAFEVLPSLVNKPEFGRRSELAEMTLTNTACQGVDLQLLKINCLPHDLRVYYDEIAGI